MEGGIVSAAELRVLLSRVEASSGPDQELKIEIRCMLGSGHDVSASRVPMPWLHCYTSSLDAAVAQVERCQPGLQWIVRNNETRGAFANTHRQARIGSNLRPVRKAAVRLRVVTTSRLDNDRAALNAFVSRLIALTEAGRVAVIDEAANVTPDVWATAGWVTQEKTK